MVWIKIIDHSYAMAERCVGERSVRINYRLSHSEDVRWFRVNENDCSGLLKRRFANMVLSSRDIVDLVYEFGIIINYDD